MGSIKVLLALVILGSVLNEGSTHQLKWGSCKKADPMPNFDPKKFSGRWYIIKKLVTTSPCLMAKFGLEGDNVLTIQELRTPSLSQMGPLDMTVTNVGKLTMDPSHKASMKLEWDGNFMNHIVDTFFTILDTDYLNYALDIECQSMTIFHRLSATIYSRTPSLPDTTIKMLEKHLVKHSVNLDRMSPIDHTSCVPLDNNDFNIKMDANGLSLLGLLNNEEIRHLQNMDQVGEYARNNVPHPGN
ncbi:apolipoprotein D-like [Macrobrachium rosenbergii]|uniref:apolipoprotein D-like n=1 Tax=Macrobrachium rosenbergii TaxID=79674 RepID=UPI0034D48008